MMCTLTTPTDHPTQDWLAWSNASPLHRSPAREYGLPTRHFKQPRVGQILAGATGPELIVAVHEHGLRLQVRDRHGRRFDLTRAEHGVWTIHPTLTSEEH